MKCDVLLLADVFEKFGDNSLKTCRLCPSHSLSVPALSCDAKLNMSKVEFELILDPDLFILFEKGIRGGVSYISNSYNKTNNKYLKSYDPKQESKQIIYLDVNNIYAYTMSKFLPTSRFKWRDPKELDLNKYMISSSKGCVLEVYLEYSKELHDDCPLTPNKTEIKTEILPNYQLKIADFYNIPVGNVKILVLKFFGKEKYVFYYENL